MQSYLRAYQSTYHFASYLIKIESQKITFFKLGLKIRTNFWPYVFVWWILENLFCTFYGSRNGLIYGLANDEKATQDSCFDFVGPSLINQSTSHPQWIERNFWWRIVGFHENERIIIETGVEEENYKLRLKIHISCKKS